MHDFPFVVSSDEKLLVADVKHFQTLDENCNFLNEFDFTSPESFYPLISDDFINKSDESNNDNNEQTIDGMKIKLINQKSSSLTVRSTPLDAIVEDEDEENPDEFEQNKQSLR